MKKNNTPAIANRYLFIVYQTIIRRYPDKWI